MRPDKLRANLLALFCWSTLLCWNALASGNDLNERIEALNTRIGELSVQIRKANSNQERVKAAELREEREVLQQELRILRRQAQEEDEQTAKASERAATEQEWAKYPPEKQLCAAIHYKRLDLVQKVISGGTINLLNPNRYCFFPLAEAAAEGHLEIVEYLLKQKSPLVMRAPPHFTVPLGALDAAAASRQDRTAMLDLLKKHGATLIASQEASLPGAIPSPGDADAQKLLLKKFNLTQGQLSSGSTLLKVLEEGHLNNILWLLKAGANPNDAMLGRTALMVAVDSNELDKIRALINAGANVNQRGVNYLSVLTYAEQRQRRVNGRRKAEMDEIISFLQARGATKSEQELSAAKAGQNS